MGLTQVLCKFCLLTQVNVKEGEDDVENEMSSPHSHPHLVHRFSLDSFGFGWLYWKTKSGEILDIMTMLGYVILMYLNVTYL